MNTVLMTKEMNQLLEKDSDTYDHSVRVASLAKILASGLNLNNQQTYQLVNGCFLHDVGKLMIPQEILSKPAALEPHEWDLMKQHPTVGAGLLQEYSFIDQVTLDAVLYHHERWDGRGYPAGLKGEEIPVCARICAIIDAFDCMVSERPYHKRLTVREAIEQLTMNAGTQFDEFYVQLFISKLKLK